MEMQKFTQSVIEVFLSGWDKSPLKVLLSTEHSEDPANTSVSDS